ncbi:hypothetical protein E4P40_03805 [Blastococcus sp. CT_GayMR20]|uniref:hypothetical protein n=1 Tax=Blastococcus sp. CT_GayMR20 TaxID=2559609 RepID=UPI0010733504|nr:hypothetical protein [Blastococcus sp. CT_GayMR20]TFV92072.1 hypothetical protein E4P40_03805 [Blastococcus sp. CT_GayMR20]
MTSSIRTYDDHGDQFPGAVPADTSRTFPHGTESRHVRMPAAPRPTGRRAPTRDQSNRRPGQATTRLGRVGQFTRSSLERFDRYTLDVFNPVPPFRPDADPTV